MGYTNVFPFQMLTYNFSNVSNDTITLSTVALDQLIATITTPDWDYQPTYAFLNLVCRTRRNTNVAENSYDHSANGYMSLTTDNIVFQSCGTWKDGEFITAPSSYAYGEYRVLGTTNLTSYIRKNTSYDVNIHNLKSYGNNLVLSNLSLELNMVFNV